ncbi:MAG: type II toxin-antitoxin system VapB family antitoxin [Acidobacteriaceae bacterium]
MALSIRNARTEKLAREVSRATGETLTEAIGKSLEERLERLRRTRRDRNLRRDLDEILTRVHALPILDNRSEEEILGYDDNGLPS